MSIKAPKVSVIVPVYNSESSLATCVNSILTQTFTDIELILVNDGSTDNSSALLAELAKKDTRVKLYEHANSGSGETRNLGLRHAKGKYICFVDSDDTLTTDAVQKLLSKTDDGVDIVIANFNEVSETGKALVHQFNGPASFDGYFSAIISFQTASSIWAKLYHRRLFESGSCYFPTGLRNNEDNATLYKLLYFAKKIEFLAEPVYFWHRSSMSKSKNIDELRVIETIRVLSDRRRFLHKKKLLKTYLSQFYEGLVFTLALRKAQILEHHLSDSGSQLIQTMYANVLEFEMLNLDELLLLRNQNPFDYWRCVFHFSDITNNYRIKNFQHYFDPDDWNYAQSCWQSTGQSEIISIANQLRQFVEKDIFVYGIGVSWKNLQRVLSQPLKIAGYIDRNFNANSDEDKFDLDGAYSLIPNNTLILISSVDQAKHILSQIVNHELYQQKTPIVISFMGVHYA